MPKKLRHNLVNLFFIFSLLLVWGGDFLYSQETGSANPNANTIQEDHDTKDLEDLLKKYNTDQQKVIEDNSKLHNIDSEKNENEYTQMESEIEALANTKRLDLAKLKKKDAIVSSVDDKLSESVKIALEPLQMLSDKELEKRFVDASKQTKFYPYLERFPKAMVFGVSMIKDREAIPSLIKTVENKKRLVTFGGIMLMTIILGLILKKLFYKADRSFLGVVFFFLLRVYTMLFVRLGIIYYFFDKELAPSISVFKKVFL